MTQKKIKCALIGPGNIGISRTFSAVPSYWHSTSQKRPRNNMMGNLRIV